MHCKIRFAQSDDIDSIVELCAEHAAYEKAPFDFKNKNELLSKHLFQDESSLECLVVEDQGKVIGYATFMKQFSTWDAAFYIYLDCLYFKLDYRGQGLGQQLMLAIRKYAIQHDCKVIQWQTPSFNKKAIRFYQKIGAVSKNKERFFWNTTPTV